MTWWMRIWFRTTWWREKIREEVRDGCQHWSEDCDGFFFLLDGTVCNPVIRICLRILFIRTNRDRWSEFRAEIHSFWHSTWKDTLWVEISTWRNFRHYVKVLMWWCNAICDSTLLIVTVYMNFREDMHRGGKLRWGNSHQNQLRTSSKDLYTGEIFRRCDQDRVSIFGKQRTSSPTVAESKQLWRATLKNMSRKFGREIGWILRCICILRCWTYVLQNWLRLYSEDTSRATQREWSTKCSGWVCWTIVRNSSRMWSNFDRREKILGWCQRFVSVGRPRICCETSRNWLESFWRGLRDCSNARAQRCGYETFGPYLVGQTSP